MCHIGDAQKIGLYIGFLPSYCPFHWACRIPAKLYCDPAEFGWPAHWRAA
jgi:hypothetical protein